MKISAALHLERGSTNVNLLSPPIREFSYLDCCRRAELLREEASKLPEGSEVLLDIGGRGKPYAPLFEGRVTHYYVVDIENEGTVDVVGDAKKIPLRNNTVDVVLCTQVLEHVNDPVAVIDEIKRVLKPKGVLLLSAPGIFCQHGSPGDYFRYMPQGLEWLLRDFRQVNVKAEAGTLSSFFLVINMYLCVFSSWSPWFQKFISWIVCPITNAMGLLAGRIHRGKQFASNYFVIAIR